MVNFEKKKKNRFFFDFWKISKFWIFWKISENLPIFDCLYSLLYLSYDCDYYTNFILIFQENTFFQLSMKNSVPNDLILVIKDLTNFEIFMKFSFFSVFWFLRDKDAILRNRLAKNIFSENTDNFLSNKLYIVKFG